MDGMRTKTKVLSLAALLTGSVVFGMILAGSLDFTKRASAQKTAAPAAAAASEAGPARAPQMIALPSFADIAEQVTPAIVSVTATDIIKADKTRRRSFHNFGNGDGKDPFEFFFGPDGGQKGRGGPGDEDSKKTTWGAALPLAREGYILTNNHVIEGAEKIEVKVGD